MTLSNSILAYRDCESLFEKAMEDDVGIRIKAGAYADAVHLRTRLHYYRKLHRLDNAKTYEAGHKMHGRSEYDVITVRIQNVEGVYYLKLERSDTNEFEIESLSE